MFKPIPSTSWAGHWLACEMSFGYPRFLCVDGQVRDAIGASAYYENRDAALAAIHAHYHDGDTVVLGDGEIRATLESEECG